VLGLTNQRQQQARERSATVDSKPTLLAPAAAGSPSEQKPLLAEQSGLSLASADMAAYCDRLSDLMSWLHADSGCSEKVLSPEQQFACCNWEVQN
jgi:hypothetical protein